jgi:flagellar biosynthesis protein FlhG
MNDQADRLRQIIENLKQRQLTDKEYTSENAVKRSAKVITVTSGKGGVGKTSISINLAIALAELGCRVVLIDADFGLANIDVLMGITPKYTLADVINNKKNILEVLEDGPKNIKFISGGTGVEELVRLDKKQLDKFIENISFLDRIFDIILIDTGAGLADSVMSCVMAADEILLVTTPEPTSITDAYALVKMVSNRDGNKVIKVIVNRADSITEANDILNKLTLVAEKFLRIKLNPLGYILQDDTVVKAVKIQQPFFICFPKSHAAKYIREISIKLVEEKREESSLKEGTQGHTGIKGFINRFVNFMNT